MVITYRCVIIPCVKKNTNWWEVSFMADKTKNFSVKGQYSILLLLGVLFLLGAVSCRAVVPQQTETQTLILEGSADTQSAEPTSTETAGVAAEVGSSQSPEADEVNQCLVCHADQQALTDTATALVVIESESSGEG